MAPFPGRRSPVWGNLARLHSKAMDVSHLHTADNTRKQGEAGGEVALRQESCSAGTAASAVAAHRCPT